MRPDVIFTNKMQLFAGDNPMANRGYKALSKINGNYDSIYSRFGKIQKSVLPTIRGLSIRKCSVQSHALFVTPYNSLTAHRSRGNDW